MHADPEDHVDDIDDAAKEAAFDRAYWEEQGRIESARLARKLARARRRPSIVLPPPPAVVEEPGEPDPWD